MKRFCKDEITRIWGDFLARIKEVGRLCECRALCYEQCGNPNYGDVLLQQLYLLRYLPAYLVEYYEMYSQMHRDMFSPNKCEVLSIGCGCGLDLRALRFYMEGANRNPDSDILYTGIDAVKWEHHEHHRLKCANFQVRNIDTLVGKDMCRYNVVVFPKSVGEFSPREYSHLCDTLGQCDWEQDVVCFLCSEPSSEGRIRFDNLRQVMTAKHGFKCEDSGSWDKSSEASIGYGIAYPEAIYKALEHLRDVCPAFDDASNYCGETCKKALCRQPMMTRKYMFYKALCFSR